MLLKVATTCTEMDTNRLPKQALQYKPKDERTWDDRGRDGGTNFILRNNEHETLLTLQEHDDDDEIAVWLEEHWLVTGRNGKGLYCKPRYTNDCGT